jgi:hypothetical protein
VTDLMPPGPGLAAANRWLIARRCGWPIGAVEACENLDRMFPGWRTRWQDANKYLDKPAGYYATHDNHAHLEPDMYGDTTSALYVAMETHRCVNWPPRALTMSGL